MLAGFELRAQQAVRMVDLAQRHIVAAGDLVERVTLLHDYDLIAIQFARFGRRCSPSKTNRAASWCERRRSRVRRPALSGRGARMGVGSEARTGSASRIPSIGRGGGRRQIDERLTGREFEGSTSERYCCEGGATIAEAGAGAGPAEPRVLSETSSRRLVVQPPLPLLRRRSQTEGPHAAGPVAYVQQPRNFLPQDAML